MNGRVGILFQQPFVRALCVAAEHQQNYFHEGYDFEL
jgi:hypothetical protein